MKFLDYTHRVEVTSAGYTTTKPGVVYAYVTGSGTVNMSIDGQQIITVGNASSPLFPVRKGSAILSSSQFGAVYFIPFLD